MKLIDHIGIFEGVLNTGQCAALIAHYERLAALNLSVTRQQIKDAAPHKKSDSSVYLLDPNVLYTTPDAGYLQPFMQAFWTCLDEYLAHYSVLGETEGFRVRSMKLQKTLPGQGYHVWHYESDTRDRCARIVAFGLYLNTVESGGETEWLYQSLRVPAVEGTLAIWPAAYTHVHRGNPPLSGEKYLLTGWLEY
jgi:hypothetical protein